MAFKMKGSPMQRNFGVGGSPIKDKKGKTTLKSEMKKDVTEEYKKTGNKKTRDAIAAGAKVVKGADGKIRIEKPAPTEMKSPAKSRQAFLRGEAKRYKQEKKAEITEEQHQAKLRKIKNVGRTNPITKRMGLKHFTTAERIH